jgi:hypothetical protein
LKSLDIWTQCEGKSNLCTLSLTAWRIVEDQHVTATRKLVDSDEEQRILEEEIETVKPPLAEDSEFVGLHYLLFSPFRYPPLKHGSRFGSRSERSLWYGAELLRTAQAEKAYYRLLLLRGSEAEFKHTEMPLTAYKVDVDTANGIDLTADPFAKFSDQIASKTDYQMSQTLGSQMRQDGIHAIRYFSARDPQRGVNIGLFTPKAFRAKEPKSSQTWKCIASKMRVEFVRADLLNTETVVFEFEKFAVDGQLPSPSI